MGRLISRFFLKAVAVTVNTLGPFTIYAGLSGTPRRGGRTLGGGTGRGAPGMSPEPLALIFVIPVSST